MHRQKLAKAKNKMKGSDVDSFLYFVRFFAVEALNYKFEVDDVHKVLASHYMKIYNYKYKFLNINIPPRHGKTELMIFLVAYTLAFNPYAKFLFITASDKLRSKLSNRIKTIIQHPYYLTMFKTRIKKDVNSSTIWETTEGGGFDTATVLGQITGFGAGSSEKKYDENGNRLFMGCVLMDDINKTDDSETENANNDKVRRVISNTILSRKNSPETPLINNQQRAGLTDATNYFEMFYGVNEPDKYHFLVLPVLLNGKPLCERVFDLNDIDKLKNGEETAHVFETQYMQNPKPLKGAMFRADELNYFTIDELRKDLSETTMGAVDVADSGKDYLSFPSGHVIGDKFYVIDWLYSQANTEITRPQVISLINNNDIDHTLIETNSFGKEFYRQVKYEVGSLNNMYGIFNKSAKNGEHGRILKVAEFIKNRFVFRTDIDPRSDYAKAMQHLTRYMKDGSFKIDDAPDSLCMIVYLMRRLGMKQFM